MSMNILSRLVEFEALEGVTDGYGEHDEPDFAVNAADWRVLMAPVPVDKSRYRWSNRKQEEPPQQFGDRTSQSWDPLKPITPTDIQRDMPHC